MAKKKAWIDDADLDKGALTRKAQAAHKTIAHNLTYRRSRKSNAT
jgi:hypothetical protein